MNTHFADDATIAELESLRQQLAEQKQLFEDYRKFMAGAAIDAKRYRFIRDWNRSDLRFVGIGLRHGDGLDAAIDSAMKESE